jgi:hypothetical protein
VEYGTLSSFLSSRDIFGSDVMSFDWNLTEKNAGLRWTFG